jgi:hypothetical protein
MAPLYEILDPVPGNVFDVAQHHQERILETL